MKIRFQRSKITLEIPEEGHMKNGWRIMPRSHPSVSSIVNACTYNYRSLITPRHDSCKRSVDCSFQGHSFCKRN